MGNPNMALLPLLSSLFIACFLLPSAYSWHKVTKVRIYLQGHFDTCRTIEYGDVYAFQEILTVGPNPNSTFLGYAQGTIAFANNMGTLYDLHVSLTYVFHTGRYKGSTVVAVGKNDLTQPIREFAIVGGTGKFKMARGIVKGTTFLDVDPDCCPLNCNPIYIYDLEIIQDRIQETPRSWVGMFF